MARGGAGGPKGSLSRADRLKQAQAALLESQRKFDTLLEHAPHAIVITDREGHIVLVNQKTEEMFGYSRHALLTQGVEILVPERFRDAHVRHRAHYLSAPSVRPLGAGRCQVGRRTDGTEFPTEIGLSYVETGEGILVMAAIADTTQRKEAEEALRESRETLRALIQASPVAICALDPDGNVTMWNPAAERIFGWSEEEVLGRPLPTIPEGKEEEHRALRQLAAGGGASTELEVQRRRKDGSLIDISLSTAPLRDPLGAVTGIVGVMVDITDQQHSAGQLRRLAGQLLEAQEEDRRQVAYDIHDGLGQLIAASSMHLESFIGHRGALQSPEVEAELRKAHHCLQDAVVEMRRMVSEVGPLLLEDVGLVEASRRLVSDFAERVGWEAEFHAEFDGDRLDRPVETALFRIVQEALANAAKYAGASRIAVSFRRDSDSLLLEVKDWGGGFDPAAVERASDRRHVGLLGMRERARLLGGDFRVESTLGEGTQVTVTVPVQQAAPVVNGEDEMEEVEMGEPGKGQGAKRQGISVLIADDHPMVREGLRSMLDAEGIQVIGEASNGSEAVEKVQQLQPDLVLMDVRMPDMDGLAATELIKQNAAETAVIVVTSYESKEYLRRAIDAGAAGYILKGMSRQSLIDAVRLVKEGGSLIDARLLAELLRDVGMDARREEAPEGALEALSPRERQVLGLLVHGLTNKEIAQEMHYSVGTVKNVVQRVIEKLGVSDRTQAAVFAVRAGLSVD
ncbi:MAG TPA: PAS domain S-box protein [Dehalococcoidia bacterium]|nr:PAS domain S-box protein [Dehalococcoidia bacterium]